MSGLDAGGRGDRHWSGLVVVANGGAIRFKGGGDTRTINGGLVLQDWTTYKQEDSNDDEFTVYGGNAVKFTCDELLKYIDTLRSIESTTMGTDRSSQLLHGAG